nr:MAG TPA: hypothetical protein [Caudoviricetes sp.]
MGADRGCVYPRRRRYVPGREHGRRGDTYINSFRIAFGRVADYITIRTNVGVRIWRRNRTVGRGVAEYG